MARYFGGFRDRLKKRSKHLPITTKDVEWVKVATTFTWSPAKRDYQWLEPEDYLSSFLSNSDSQYDDLGDEIQGDGSIDAAMSLPFSGSEYDGSESLLNRPSSDETDEEESNIAYIPPYDFVPEPTPAFNDEAVLRPNIDVPADLPMLDEYKLEIVSALQRRGIKIDSSKIKLPEDLSAQLNGYHEGRVSIDSYELRARLQKYKRQVIESYEKFSAVSGSINPDSNGAGKSLYDEEASLKPPKSSDSNYESFILTSLNRLEASMNEDELAFETGQADVSDSEVVFDFNQGTDTNQHEISDILGPDNYDVFDESNQTLDVRGAIRTTRHIETPPDTSDILAEGLTGADLKNGSSEGELPSSYADDSWLVLPVDSRKAGKDLENPDDLDNTGELESTGEIEIIGEFDNIGEDTLVVDILGASADLLDPLDEEDGALESNRADSSELLKALNTINSRFPESSSDTDSIELTTDLVDLEIEALRDTPEPITAPESVVAPIEASVAEPTPESADETSLSELLLQLRHEGDKTVLDDTNVPGKSESSGSSDEERIGAGHEADLLIGIEPALESTFLEDIDSASATFAGHTEQEEPVTESRPQTHAGPEEIKPVSLDLENDLQVMPDTALNLTDETVPARQDAVPGYSKDVSGEDVADVVNQAFEKQDRVIPAPEESVTENRSNDLLEETVEQSRARFIEEERKKLYSLIGDLEESASLTEETENDVNPSVEGTVQGSTASADSMRTVDPEKTETPEALANQPVAQQSAPMAKSALIEHIMAAKEQLKASGTKSDQDSSPESPEISNRFAAKDLVELSDELEKNTHTPFEPVITQDSKKAHPEQPERLDSIVEPFITEPSTAASSTTEPSITEPSITEFATTEPSIVASPIIKPKEIEANEILDPLVVGTRSKDRTLDRTHEASDSSAEDVKQAPVLDAEHSSGNIINPEPVVQPLPAGEQRTRESNLDSESVHDVPPIVKPRSFGSLGEIEPAPPYPKTVERQPETPLPETALPETALPETALPETAQPKTTQPNTPQPEADQAEKQEQSVRKAFVREESLHNVPPLSLDAVEPVFSPEPGTPGLDKTAMPAEPSDESRVAVDQKAFKVNALVDQGNIERERIALNKAEHPGIGPSKKSAEKDAAPLKSELSGSALAGHNTESEQLRPVSIDKTFMSEPQTTEEETPAVSDASPSKPVEIVTSPTPDVESPGVVIVELDGVGVDNEASAEEIIDEGLIEADEAQGPEVSLTHVIESLAFATEDPIPLKKIARIYSEALGVKMPTEKNVRAALAKLNEEYTTNGRSYRIKEWAGGVRMASHPQYARFIRALYKDNRPKKLSRTLMETLAIIAYSQPSTKPEIDYVRGVDSDYAVRKLLELGLIDIVGRSDSIGRPLLYGTSERFLEQFGLSGIEALPKLREVEELLGDPAFKKERLQLLALEDMDTANKYEKESSEEAGTDNGSDEQAPADVTDGSEAARSVSANSAPADSEESTGL